MGKGDHIGTEPYKGVRDFYPEDWGVIEAVFRTIRNTLGLWGYEEYNASPLERAELYESKTSEEIVSEQTYTFYDRGERRVTLRPEMTPTFARMVSKKRREIPIPLRWYSIPNVFRYERPQRGRLREHYQLNVDLAGASGVEADGEIILVASQILKALGAAEKDFVIRISSRTLLSAACAVSGFNTEEAVRIYGRLLDKKGKMTSSEFESALGADKSDPLRMIELGKDPEVTKEKEKIMNLIKLLKEWGVTNAVFDPEIVRGFDYYTGIVFEIYDTHIENPRAIGGGGRYDDLISLFGGEALPCVGIAIGDVTLLDFLTTHNILPEADSSPQLYIGTPTETDFMQAQNFAQELRQAGIRTIVNSTRKNLGDQIRDASRRGIPFFIAFGEQEAASGISGLIRLKSLENGEEKEVSRAKVAENII